MVRRRHLQLLSLLVFVVFASTLGGEFVWTDHEDLVLGAYRVDTASDLAAAFTLTGEEFRNLTLSAPRPGDASDWQPLVIAANSVSWWLWGDCAFCFHLENLLLHLALVIGIYALGRHLLSQRRHGNRIAVWAAALFAVHPATVSTVAWIGGQQALIAAGFSIWALVIFTRLPATTKSRPGHVRRWLIGLAVTSTGAMLAQASAMMLPLLALFVAAFEAMERGRHPFGGISPRRWKGLAVLLGVTLLLAFYRFKVVGAVELFAGHPADGFFANLGTALRHFWFLVAEAVLPGEPIVSDTWPVTTIWGSAEVASLLGLVVLLVATVVGMKFHHPGALGVGWFLLWLLPAAALFPGAHYHDSQVLYLPVWGLALALAYLLLQLWRPLGRQLMPGSEALMFVPILLVLGVITAFSNVRWWDQRGLFESEVASDPLFLEGRIELAEAVLQAGEPALAADHLNAAIKASGDARHTGYFPAFDAYVLLGRAQSAIGQFEEAGQSFAEAEALAPTNPELAYWRGVASFRAGQFGEAETRFRRALQLRAGYADAEADLGAALAAQGRYEEAYPLLAAAMADGRGGSRHHRALAMVLIDGHRYAEAARELEASLMLDDDPVERARLAWVQWQDGKREQARKTLRLAIDDAALLSRDSDYLDWVREQIDPDDALAAPDADEDETEAGPGAAPTG